MAEFFAILSGLVVLVGAPFYLMDILKGTTKPERVTWFIWSVLGVIAFFSQKTLGAHWSLVYAGMDALGSIVVFLLSLKYGVGGWARLDKFALAIALAGVVVSFIVHAPLIALLGIIIADAAGAALTIRKTYVNPESETAITWFCVGTSSLLAALSVGRISLGLLIYPIYLMFANYGVLVAKLFGHLFKKTLPVAKTAQEVVDR